METSSSVPVATDLEPQRVWFDDRSWVDITRGWVLDAPAVYRELVGTLRWEQGRIWRYEKWLDEPRLGSFAQATALPHPAIAATHDAVQRRYGVRFDGVAFAYYRDQRDSVAFHRDREMRYLDDTVVAILTLGAQRPFLVGPRGRKGKFSEANGAATHDLKPRGGDLMVFGGRFQADWEHAVPKVGYPVSGRISAQWRWTSRRGRPEVGANYSAPREFSRGRPR
jgi:alkylated DNA repair dioxygenase AlkB